MYEIPISPFCDHCRARIYATVLVANEVLPSTLVDTLICCPKCKKKTIAQLNVPERVRGLPYVQPSYDE